MPDCPSTEQWQHLLDGQASEAEQQSLERHLCQCFQCEQLLARLTEATRGDVPILPADRRTSPEAESFLRTLKQLPTTKPLRAEVVADGREFPSIPDYE